MATTFSFRAHGLLARFRSRMHHRRYPKVQPSVRFRTGRVVAVHFPKAGGSSLRSQFANLLGPSLKLDYHNDPLVFAARHSAVFPRNKQMVMGHFHASRYEQTDAFMMTFLRDPVENLVSIFNFWRTLPDHGHPLHSRFLRDQPDILEFARHPSINSLMAETYFGDFDLGRLDFIGFHETRDYDIPKLSEVLGVPLNTDVHINSSTPLDEQGHGDAQLIVRQELRHIIRRDVNMYERLRNRWV